MQSANFLSYVIMRICIFRLTMNFSISRQGCFSTFSVIILRKLPHVEQDLHTLPEYLRSPLVFGGVRVVYSLVFYVVSCVLLFVCLSFFILSHGVVSLFSIYEFDCSSGIFRPSFWKVNCKKYTHYFSIRFFYWFFWFFLGWN